MSSKAPLITDVASFIAGANATPAPASVGPKAADAMPEAGQGGESPVAPSGTQAAKQKREKTKPAKKQDQPEIFPWEKADPRVIKYFQVRMPEPLQLKLRWIVENAIGNKSMHDIVLQAINESADRYIAEIRKRQKGEQS